MDGSDSPRILIARMSAVGDTILTLPVACALRRRYPHAYLAWVVEKNAAPVVLGHPCLDDVVVLPRGWFATPRGIAAARRQLKPLNVQFAVDCQSITKTALACRLSGATTRIGCHGPYGAELSPWLNNVFVEPRKPHLTDRSLELLTAMGVDPHPVQWQFPLTPTLRDRARQLTDQLHLDGPFAVINPGATWDSKLWEMDRFAVVSHHLAARHDVRTLVVWGNARERGWAEQIVAQSDGHAVLAPATTLLELAAVIARSSLFISSDTGPLHMAVAVGTPSIGLYGTTRPQDCGPYGSPHVAVQAYYHAGSRRHRRQTDNRAMQAITCDMVCAAVDDLARRQQPADPLHHEIAA